MQWHLSGEGFAEAVERSCIQHMLAARDFGLRLETNLTKDEEMQKDSVIVIS